MVHDQCIFIIIQIRTGQQASALKQAFPSIKEPPASDICYATTKRQEAGRALGPKSDLVIVVGSRNS